MMTLPNPGLLWPIPYEAVREIAKHEGCRLKAYRDIVGVWTCGWGETRGVTAGMAWTQQQADERFCESLTEFAEGVRKLCTNPPSDNELGAMVSLAYNIGLGGFARSTVLKKHNAGDYQSAARAFALWNKAGGQVVRGLTLRRAKEAALYLTPDEGEFEAMPQRVDAESSLSQSPIAQSGAISIAGGVIAAASAALDPVKDIAATLNVEPLMVFGALGIVIGLIVLTQRNKQRSEGWA
jgi:lysozyme